MKNKATETLNRLDQLLSKMDEEVYTKTIPAAGDATIGKHTRHILEFFQCLFEQAGTGIVNYDHRERDMMIENRISVARQLISKILADIGSSTIHDRKLTLETEGHQGAQGMDTTFDRELWYNVEHAIHHMAIIKMVIGYEYPHLKPDDDFGVAYSTVQYNNEALQTD